METERTAGTIAIHDQIADDLRARIVAGEYKPDDALPSIRELRQQWGCSDGPVRDAFAILRSEGRITSGRGAPARVRKPPERKPLWISFGPEAVQQQKDMALRSEEERTSAGTAELALGVPISKTHFSASYERIPADRELAEEFSIEPGSELLRRTYKTTYKSSGKLALSSISYIPVSLISTNPALLDESNEPWPGGHWHQLYTVGIEIDRLQNSIIAIQPTTRQRQDWAMQEGVPLLCLRNRSIDTQGRVVEVSDAFCPADRTAINYSYQLERWSE